MHGPDRHSIPNPGPRLNPPPPVCCSFHARWRKGARPPARQSLNHFVKHTEKRGQLRVSASTSKVICEKVNVITVGCFVVQGTGSHNYWNHIMEPISGRHARRMSGVEPW